MNLLSRVKHVLVPQSEAEREPNWLAGTVAFLVPIAFLTIIEVTDSPSAIAQDRPDVRSSERDAAPRRSPEADAPRRRSPEADAPARRSPEADAEQRRGNDRDGATLRDPRRDGDDNLRRDTPRPIPKFEPQNERERALLGIISQLREEIAQLRREVGSRGENTLRSRRTRTDDPVKDPVRFELSERWQLTRDGKVFMAYDKNRDQSISLEEWLAMTNGNINEERRALQTRRFRDAEPSGDDRFTPREFLYWYSIGRHRSSERDGDRDGAGVEGRVRDGDASPERRRDGDQR